MQFSRVKQIGQVRAAKALMEKRAKAAAVITALGRGFQGRGEARRLRVNLHNLAARKIQRQLRTRTAARYEPDYMANEITVVSGSWNGRTRTSAYVHGLGEDWSMLLWYGTPFLVDLS